MPISFTRRNCLTSLASTAIASATVVTSAKDSSASETESNNREVSVPPISLNTSTIRGQKLAVPEQINVAADAGYDGIEPWIRDLRNHVEQGGSVSDLKKQLDDRGLAVSGAIGFAKWIVSDPDERKKALEEARRDMELIRQLGGNQMAAPPIGAHNEKSLAENGPLDLNTIALRYRDLLDVGAEMGVTPLLELWGFSPTLSQLGELAYVATQSAHASAAVLPDFYHIYKGGNEMTGLGMIEASRMPLFHINDYPAEPTVDTIADKDRVFPGDGVCPLIDTIALLLRNGFRGTFSLELFNPDYWTRPAAEVASEGYRKSKSVIDQAVMVANAK